MTKKLSLSAFALMGLALTSCGTLVQGTTTQSTTAQTTSNTTQTTTSNQDALSAILNGAVGAASSSVDSSLGGILGNILSSVTGSATTTQANLIGTWTYTEPSVQFESENLLTQAGGAAAATKVESQLTSIYQMVGITQGNLLFAFTNDGKVTYQFGGYAFEGTYVFDSSKKTVTITTTTGLSLKAYVTISGNQMSLCFDSSKLLALLGSVGGSSNSTLGTIGSMAKSFSGMKMGFKFVR